MILNIKIMNKIILYLSIFILATSCQESKNYVKKSDIKGELIAVTNNYDTDSDPFFISYFKYSQNPITLYRKINEDTYELMDSSNIGHIEISEIFSAFIDSKHGNLHIDIMAVNQAIEKKSDYLKGALRFAWNENYLDYVANSLYEYEEEEKDKAIEIKINEADSLALLALYNSTQGENWTNKWDLTKPVSEWYGVKLNSFDSAIHVVDLELNKNNLEGTIPVDLLKLKHFDIRQTLMFGNEMTFNQYADKIEPNISINHFEEVKLLEQDKFTVFVQKENGIDIFEITKEGERGKAIGRLTNNEEITTTKEFKYVNKNSSLDENNYYGNYIKVLHGSDTVFVYSVFLSSIPTFIDKAKIKMKLTFREEIYYESTETYSQKEYVNDVISIKKESYEGGSQKIIFNKEKYTFQEIYIYANNNIRNNAIFTKYFGKGMPKKSIDESFEDDEYSVKKQVQVNANGEIPDIRVFLNKMDGGMSTSEDYTITVNDKQIILKSSSNSSY